MSKFVVSKIQKIRKKNSSASKFVVRLSKHLYIYHLYNSVNFCFFFTKKIVKIFFPFYSFSTLFSILIKPIKIFFSIYQSFFQKEKREHFFSLLIINPWYFRIFFIAFYFLGSKKKENSFAFALLYRRHSQSRDHCRSSSSFFFLYTVLFLLYYDAERINVYIYVYMCVTGDDAKKL